MKILSREEQHAQCMREVKATLIVVAICAVWHIGTAFALNGSDLFILGMPAWFTVSVGGTCILGIAGVVILSKFVFIDFAYDPEVDETLIVPDEPSPAAADNAAATSSNAEGDE